MDDKKPGRPNSEPSPKADPIRGGEPRTSPDTRKGADLPAAGPHADPSLINPDATPGTDPGSTSG